jgi:L-alanine-DL-glutamate epimerase-like enolase superfamily enzyme
LDRVPRELQRLDDLAARLPPGVALRLDANGAWEADAARAFIAGVAALPVESLEEPLRQPDRRSLSELQRGAPFALALDESLVRYRPQALLARPPVRRLVLKPGVLGGLLPTRELAQAASAAGIEVVFTSLVESAAGVWPTLQLAASLPGDLAHGLATSSWLARDLGEPPEAAHGVVALPLAAGSGFHPAAPEPGAAQLRRA